jgi:large subunit ribosomal protein L5
MTQTESPTSAAATAPRLKTRYREEILPALQAEFEIKNVMQVPGLTKIVVNMGVGEAARDSKLIEGAIKDLTACPASATSAVSRPSSSTGVATTPSV